MPPIGQQRLALGRESGAGEAILFLGIVPHIVDPASPIAQADLQLDLFAADGRQGVFVAVQKDVLSAQAVLKQRLALHALCVVRQLQRIQQRRQNVHVTGRRVDRPRGEQRAVHKQRGCAHVFVEAHARVRIVVRVLAKRLPVIADHHQNRIVQDAAVLQVLVNPLNLPVEKAQIVVVLMERPGRAQHVRLRAVVWIGPVRHEAVVDRCDGLLFG